MSLSKRRVLFIDRDGTIIVEPTDNKQVDSLSKLEFIPKAIVALSDITTLNDFELVMVTNQDGLGTKSFPEEEFWPAHNLMIKTLAGEGVVFTEVLIDRSLPSDNAPTRKPGTGLLGKYITGDYDLENSYVIGDRETDLELARNLGAKGIFYGEQAQSPAALVTKDWSQIYEFLRTSKRKATVIRETNETSISVELKLDGSGKSVIKTGLGFFDHMLEQVFKHSNMDGEIKATGDLHIDEHHLIEDTALALGECLAKALGDKRSITRYAYLLAMDEALAHVAIDLGGRSYLVWDAEFKREKIGEMPTEMFKHFFHSVSTAGKFTLNVRSEGENEHHKIESIFKGFGRVLGQAISLTSNDSVPSTKGVI